MVVIYPLSFVRAKEAFVILFQRIQMQGSLSVLSYSDTHVRMLEDCIQETILEQNKLAAGSDRSVSHGSD